MISKSLFQSCAFVWPLFGKKSSVKNTSLKGSSGSPQSNKVTSSVAIRGKWEPATSHDLPQLRRLLKLHLKETEVPKAEWDSRWRNSLKYLKNALKNPSTSAILVFRCNEYGNTPKGMGLMAPIDDIYPFYSTLDNAPMLSNAFKKVAYMGLGFIQKNLRGNRLGYASLYERVRVATEKGYDAVYLVASNDEMVVMVEKVGFEPLPDTHPIMNELVKKRDMTGKTLCVKALNQQADNQSWVA